LANLDYKQFSKRHRPHIHPPDAVLFVTYRLAGSNDYPGLSKIMHSLKGRSARESNLILARSGSFWEHESFDHVIRPGKFDATIKYVLNNPVKAGLAKHWREWPWNYCREELSDKL